MKKILTAAFVMSIIFGAFGLEAKDRTFGQYYTECGIWGMVFPENETLAAIFNVTTDLGTTAISSGTTTPDACKGGKGKMAALLYKAYPAVEEGIAKGQGEYLDALIQLASVKPENSGAFVSGLRGGYANEISLGRFSEKSLYERAETLFELIEKEAQKTS